MISGGATRGFYYMGFKALKHPRAVFEAVVMGGFFHVSLKAA